MHKLKNGAVKYLFLTLLILIGMVQEQKSKVSAAKQSRGKQAAAAAAANLWKETDPTASKGSAHPCKKINFSPSFAISTTTLKRQPKLPNVERPRSLSSDSN